MPTTSLDVAIVGAGAAGLTAAYDLIEGHRGNNHLNVQILEASSWIGGRVKKLEAVNFGVPIDLGGEWLHGKPSMLEEIASTQSTTRVETMEWRPYSYRYHAQSHEWTSHLWFMPDDHKFVNSTWFV